MIKLAIADESHARVVAHLLAELFQEVEHTPTEDELAEIFEGIEADGHHSTLLALDDDDDVVGVITLTESLAFYAGGYIGVVNELYVVPNYRSEGVGKILLDAAKELGQERGWKRLEVTTPGDDFQKTLKFYEREGFMKIGPRYKYEMSWGEE